MRWLFAFLPLLLSSRTALACAACAGKGFPARVIAAYVNATVVLAALPFLVGGALLLLSWVLRSKARQGSRLR